jgi:hypothetical protein
MTCYTHADPLMLIDPLRALSDLRAREALEIPVPDHLQRALRGDVPPAKATTSPKKPAGPAHAVNGASEPSERLTGAHEAPDRSESPCGKRRATKPSAEPPAKVPCTGSPDGHAAEGATPHQRNGWEGAAPVDTTIPAGQAAVQLEPSSLAVGSWSTTSKRSPQKGIASGSARGAGTDSPASHVWGSSDFGVGSQDTVPLPTEVTAASVRAFVGALRQRLPEMVHRGVPRACAQLEALCRTLLGDLEGRGRVDVLAQFSAGVQV